MLEQSWPLKRQNRTLIDRLAASYHSLAAILPTPSKKLRYQERKLKRLVRIESRIAMGVVTARKVGL